MVTVDAEYNGFSVGADVDVPNGIFQFTVDVSVGLRVIQATVGSLGGWRGRCGILGQLENKRICFGGVGSTRLRIVINHSSKWRIAIDLNLEVMTCHLVSLCPQSTHVGSCCFRFRALFCRVQKTLIITREQMAYRCFSGYKWLQLKVRLDL